MNGALRQRLRVEIDAAVRASLPTYEDACAGCGAPHLDPWSEEPHYTAACRTCSERRASRAKRARHHAGQLALVGEEAA